jgi:hypothetical protein
LKVADEDDRVGEKVAPSEVEHLASDLPELLVAFELPQGALLAVFRVLDLPVGFRDRPVLRPVEINPGERTAFAFLVHTHLEFGRWQPVLVERHPCA